MFQIVNEPIETILAREQLSNPQAGGFVAFEGWVRNHNEGKSVTALEYEAFEELACKEGNRILEEAKARFDILEAHCIHRVGQLAIGKMAVWVGVCAKHRGAAFEACEYIIDEVKHRVPIWKKEYYTDGDSGWVNCEQCASHAGVHHVSHTHTDKQEERFYSRQMCLSDIGPEGQEKLKASKVLVVGAGGLGSPALMYLAAAGVGTLGICEFDHLEISNLHRQVLYDSDSLGQPKAELAAARLRQLNPFIQLEIHPEKLDADSIESLFQQYNLVLDCTDNFVTKFLMNDAAVLTGTPLIQSSIYQYEGQLHLYSATANSPCLRCLWPEMPEPGCVGTCADVGVLGAVPGVFGALQALEALKFMLNLPGRLMDDALLVFNLLTYETQHIRRKRSPQCPVCGTSPSILTIDPVYYGLNPENWEIELSSLTREELNAFELIDIREPHETAMQPLEGVHCFQIPGRDLIKSPSVLDNSKKYLLFCQKGLRSQQAAKHLRDQGYTNVYALTSGGISMLQSYLNQSQSGDNVSEKASCIL